MKRIVCLIAFITTLVGLASAEEAAVKADFFVATDGSDDNAGSAEKPFATLARARDEVRKKIAAGLGADLTVLIRAGTYEQRETLTFGPKDSGPEKHSITYAAYPGEKVIVSGGRKLSGWNRKEKLWTTQIPEVAEGKWYFTQLFVDDQRATRARTPNKNDSAPYFRISGVIISNDNCTLKFAPGQVADWKDSTDVEAIILRIWEISRKRLAAVDGAPGTVTLTPPYFKEYDALCEGMNVYFENARVMLDQPGEWHLNRATGDLAYWPLPKEDLTKAEIVAPVLRRLLEVRGTPEQPVRNLHFKGIQFAHTARELTDAGFVGTQATFYRVSKAGSVRLDDALRLEYTQGCSIEDGQIAHVGETGISLRQGCSNNLIQGNRIFDVGGNGVMIGEAGDPTNTLEIVTNNRVTNNHVHDCGTVFHGAVGIWVGIVDNTTVAHNLVENLPYTGISVGWRWNTQPSGCKSNLVEFNHIRTVSRLLWDAGAVYTLGYQPGTIIRGNLIHDVQRSRFSTGPGNGGIFIDNGSSGFLIEKNSIHCWEPVRLNTTTFDGSTSNNVLVQTESPGFPKGADANAGLEPKYRSLLLRRN